MPVAQPTENVYQRSNRKADERKAAARLQKALPNYKLSDLPPYRLTSITEWGALFFAKTGEIKAKTASGLVTFYTCHPVLDWEWLQRQHEWITCPQCGRSFPKDAQYWWIRNREKGYFWLDACRDCKCSTSRRWGPRKRIRMKRAYSVHD